MVACEESARTTVFGTRSHFLHVSLLAAFFLIAGVAWSVQETFRGQHQERVVEQLRAQGASAYFNYQEDAYGAFDPDSAPGYPRWWRDLTSAHFGVRVTEVSLLNASPGNEMLQLVSRLDDLRRLLADNSRRLTDGGLPYLADLGELRELSLAHTAIKGPGLVHLQGLRHLKVLRLSSTEIDDRALFHLRSLSSMQILELASTRITGAGVRHLRCLRSLERLGLQNTLVDDDALATLARLHDLQQLDITQTQISPEGAAWLREQLPQCSVFY